MRTCLIVVLSLLAASCAPSPLYVSERAPRTGTGGDVPRDTRGEPILSAIKPAPVVANPTPPPSR